MTRVYTTEKSESSLEQILSIPLIGGTDDDVGNDVTSETRHPFNGLGRRSIVMKTSWRCDAHAQ
jgi:hypothetical protein